MIQGWGWEDIDLVNRLRLFGLEEGTFPSGLLRGTPHSDGRRVEHYRVKDCSTSLATNMIYCRAKADLMRSTGLIPNPEFLRTLYDRAARHVSGSEDEIEKGFGIDFRRETLPDGTEVIGSLRYSIRRPGSSTQIPPSSSS